MEIREAEAEAAVMSRQTHGGDGDGVLCRHLVTVNLHEEMCGGLDCLQPRKAIRCQRRVRPHAGVIAEVVRQVLQRGEVALASLKAVAGWLRRILRVDQGD